jgi:hypothetical protein
MIHGWKEKNGKEFSISGSSDEELHFINMKTQFLQNLKTQKTQQEEF